MDMFSEEEPITTEQLTVVQINQLKEAWQRANAELVKYKDIAYNLQQKVENLTSVINDSYSQLEMESAKTQLSQLCCSIPNKPVVLVKELATMLPKMNYHNLVATAFIKTGESWIALSSSTVTQETINFKSRVFDDMLRFRSRSKTSKVTVETLPSILPLPVINYIHSGTVPATESAFDIFNDESKGHGNLHKHIDHRNATSAENLYHEAIILRLSGSSSSMNNTTENQEHETANISERCVWMITVAPQYQANSGIDIYTDEIPIRRLAVDQFGAHPLVLNGSGDYYSKDSATNPVCIPAMQFWFPLLDYAAQLTMTSLLHFFETKRMNKQVLQSDAVAEFSNLLNNATAIQTADLILESAGVQSHITNNNMIETMSQRSDEDDVLQSNTLLDDAYWDRVWQSVPSALDDFLTQHIEGFASTLPINEEEDGQSSNKVHRTCHCEVYIGSGTLIEEVSRQGTGSSHAASAAIAGLTEIPLINTKRLVSLLKLQETESVDGHVDAVNTVLRSAFLRDEAAVQSYSEVSFHERTQVSSSNVSTVNKGNKYTSSGSVSGLNKSGYSQERGPHVEFHTVVAVPLLHSEQQEAVYQHMTTAEEREMGEVKGCILVHVTSVLVEGVGSSTMEAGRALGSLSVRAHPTYAASFSTNSTSTHSAYMEHIAGSYSLLESGRQPLVMGVVDVMEVLGGMLLTFLYAHNCRPMNLLPMTVFSGGGVGPQRDTESLKDVGSESAVALSALMGSASTSYADASRWNNCITDGLYSLILPESMSTHSAALQAGVNPSLESLAYTDEAKVSNPAFHPLSRDHVVQHNAQAANIHAALVYHLCTLFHSDWTMVFTADTSERGTTGRSAVDGVKYPSGERSTRWAPRLNNLEEDESSMVKLINNIGSAQSISTQEIPMPFRSIVVQHLTSSASTSSNLRGGGHHSRHHHHQQQTVQHEFIREIPGVRSLPISALLSLLHVDPRLRQSIHQVCDSGAAVPMHHMTALCLDPHSALSFGALGGHGQYNQKGQKDVIDSLLPHTSNIVILTGRFFRGPFHAPFPVTPSVSQLNVLFQTAIARRDLLLSKATVTRLIEEKTQSIQEVSYAKSLEERLNKLHRSTLSGQSSNISSLVAFRKGLLSILIDFFSELHRLHYACYRDTGDGKGLALEVIGIELVVDESTGLEEGRHRKWALSSSTADWVRVLHSTEGSHSSGITGTSAFQRAGRKKVTHTSAVAQTLHSQLNVSEFIPPQANLTAEVVVDELNGVYEEKGAAVLHVHREHRRHDDDRHTAASMSEDETLEDMQDLIGMFASIHIHYELPVALGRNMKENTRPVGSWSAMGGNFFASLPSSPVWMRILRNFIGLNSQALFQPLYPIYTPLKLQNSPYQQISIDEEQQWEDDALYAQASNIAINALSSAIVQDSTRVLNTVTTTPGDELYGTPTQHPHYRYLHQRKLLRQLTVVPPFSAFMLIPIRELTTTEVSAFDDDSSTDSDSTTSSAMDVADVRYMHLLPSTHQSSATAVSSGSDRRKQYNPILQSLLPIRLNESIRDAVRSARHEHAATEQVLDADAKSTRNRRSEGSKTALPTGNHRLRTSRLTVLDGGMGGVLHSYLSELHERQQRRRSQNSAHRGNHEYDLYGYVDVGPGASADKTGRTHTHSHEMALVDPHSLVLLYTPLLHCTRSKTTSTGLDALEEEIDTGGTHDQGLLTGDTNAALDHYYLVICRQDRMIVPSSLVRLQTCLDELFLPSRVLAASQPWFECMSGIEQLVKAATSMDTSAEFKAETAVPNSHSDFFSDDEHHSHDPRHHTGLHIDLPSETALTCTAPVVNVEGQVQRILMESITIMKNILGDRCLGAVGYQLHVNQNDLPELLSSTSTATLQPPSVSFAATSENYRSGTEIELVRCCSDLGLVSSKSGKVMTMLQGPAKLQCPATVENIINRYSPVDVRNHRDLVAGVRTTGSPQRKHDHHHHPRHHHSRHVSDDPSHAVAIHYVEMSSLEHIKELQHSATSGNVINSIATPRSDGTASPTRARRATNVTAVQEVLNAAHLFLRADVRVLQLLITSCPTNASNSQESIQPHVVASVLLYLSQSEESVAAEENIDGTGRNQAESLPTVAYIHRDDVIQNAADTIGISSLHRNRSATHRVHPPHVSSLTKGILSCVMRVGDTTGALISASYRQQYDSLLQAYTTGLNRAQMQVHSQRLANALAQIDHELTVAGNNDKRHGSEGPTSPHRLKRSVSPSHSKVFRFEDENPQFIGHDEEQAAIMTQFLADTNNQKEAAEHALQSTHNIIAQFASLKDHFLQEQHKSTEIHSKYKASMEECRRKATQFRCFYEAVRAANQLLPPARSNDDDVDSINSGLDKVAEYSASVPESKALQSAIASTVCNTQTLRKALEMLTELAVHEEFSGFFNTLLNDLSVCASDEISVLESHDLSVHDNSEEEGDRYDRTLYLLNSTPFNSVQRLAEQGVDAGAPDISATVWWVLEPSSHINAINLSNAIQSANNSLDPNTLHSREKFLEALNTKQAVLVEGDELLQKLPHIFAYFSAHGHNQGDSHLPVVRVLYQPILATLAKEGDLEDDLSYTSADGSDASALAGETMVVAVVQYVMVGGTIGSSAASLSMLVADHSILGEGSAVLGQGGVHDSSLSAIMRQVGRECVEQAIAYMGQHVTLQSSLSNGDISSQQSVAQFSRSVRYNPQDTITSSMHQFIPRIVVENNMIGGVQWKALMSTLSYIMDPVNASPPAPVASASVLSSKESHLTLRRGKSTGTESASGRRHKRSGGSVKSFSHSSHRSSDHKAQLAEKIAAAAVYHPISVWIGKLLATVLRADGASMLHIMGSIKTPTKVRSSTSNTNPLQETADTNTTAEKYAHVVYEGVLYNYRHGTVVGGAASDERSSLNILHMRPSSWTPLQELIEKYLSFHQSSAGEGVFVTYHESVLGYTRKASSSVYSSRSVASQSGVSLTTTGNHTGKMRYILAYALNTSSVLPSTAPTGSNSSTISRRNVHFVDPRDQQSAAQLPLKENDDFIVVELSHRPTSADLKAFSSVSQLVQTFLWSQTQRNCIKQKETELNSISGALASSSQRLVEEQQENQQHRHYAELMQELSRQQNRSLTERSLASVTSGDTSVLYGKVGEGSLRLTDIKHSLHRSQDLLCETFGHADMAVLISAPRLVCTEIRDLLRSDTLSVASRGSSGMEEELLGARIDTVTRNMSKRALARTMAVEHIPTIPGVINMTEFQEAAEEQYRIAQCKFAAMAVQLGVILVCDVADVIAEEAMSLNLNTSKTSVPAIARSIIVPILDCLSELSTASKKASTMEEEDEEGEDLLPTSRLSWLDSTLRAAVASVLGRKVAGPMSPDPQSQQGAYYQQYYFDQRPQQKTASHAVVSSTCPNSAHAWALQIVFPTLQARDQYVTALLGGTPQSAPSVSPMSTPPSSPTRGGPHTSSSVLSNGSALYMRFLTGVTQYLRNSFEQCRSSVKHDIIHLQNRVEVTLTEKVAACMDQVLVMCATQQSVPSECIEDDIAAEVDPMEFTVDAIAAAVAHVFQQNNANTSTAFSAAQYGGHATTAEEDSDSENERDARSASPTAAFFDCALVDARMHWIHQPPHISRADKVKPSVSFHDTASLPSTGVLSIGSWYTVNLTQPVEQSVDDSNSDEGKITTESKHRSSAKGSAAGPGSKREGTQQVALLCSDSEGFKLERDENLYLRCRDRQWRTQRSTLTTQQVQAVKESPEGLLVCLLPATMPPLGSKPKSVRSASPLGRAAPHTGGYSSASKHRPGVYFGTTSGEFSDYAQRTDDDQSAMGAYLNSDGTVQLQVLVLIPGSEQPAVLELSLKCHITAGESSPDHLIRSLTKKRSKKKPSIAADELALAEMIEQIALRIIQPTLPTLRIVRSSVAHLLEHCVAARGLVTWESDWERYLQHAQQRISLLSSCMTLLTAEGMKAAGLLQQVQETLCRLPALQASTLICRDTATNQIIYNRTMDYINNETTDYNAGALSASSATTTATGVGGLSSSRLSFQSPGTERKSVFTFPDSAFSGAAATPSGTPSSTRALSPSHRVAYMDISKRNTARKQGSGGLSSSGSTALELAALTLNTPMSLREETESLKNQFGNIEALYPALDSLEQLELVFDCYEVQGSLTVYFTPDHTLQQEEEEHDMESGYFSPVKAATGRSKSPSRQRPTSPYEPLQSPGAHRRAKEHNHRTSINTSNIPSRATSPSSRLDATDTSHTDQLVSLSTLLETITRAAARRVFELHRGSKNKRMIASKQQELSQRNTQLQKQDEKLESLERMNNLSRQELQLAAAESERLRLLMYTEQRNLKEALKQKKELNSHLRQSLLEIRQEYNTKNILNKKQYNELNEKIRLLEINHEKELKNIEKYKKKEIIADNTTNTLTQQIAELQRLQKTAEATIRQLRVDLATNQKELAACQAKEKTRTHSEDGKIQGFLQKITRLDEELIAARGTNSFLKKQLDATTQELRRAQETK